VTLAFCWAHVRRRCFELAAAGPAPIASEALQYTASLYHIESEIRSHGADERRAVRQESSRPILQALEPWLRVPAKGRRVAPRLLSTVAAVAFTGCVRMPVR
jgi:transposase